jgi:hypothetical protein
MSELPRFGFDTFDELENWALLVAGRFVDEPSTAGEVKRIEEFVRQWASKTGLPLAYVHLGTTINWEDEGDDDPDYECAPAIIGLVQAYTGGASPLKLQRLDLKADAFASIPAEFWAALKTNFSLSMRDDGVYLAASGWTVAAIYPGDAVPESGGEYFEDEAETLVLVCTDGTGCKMIEIATLPDEFWLHSTYA